MRVPNILVQLDPDSQASLFDAVVAIDSTVDHLLQYRNVELQQVRDLVYGAIFTRRTDQLKHTAIFVGGSNVAKGEELFAQVQSTFFGPMRVSVMMDANGANTTAAAAVVAAARHLELDGSQAVVLGGTGPVGQRVALLLAASGCDVRIGSRNKERADAVAAAVARRLKDRRLNDHCRVGSLRGADVDNRHDISADLQGCQLVIAAGAPGIVLLPTSHRRAAHDLKVAIDLNAVPPLGIEGVDVTDKGKELEGVCCYGAIGVGGTKMKIHKAAIAQLFASNDQVFDAEEIFEIGKSMS